MATKKEINVTTSEADQFEVAVDTARDATSEELPVNATAITPAVSAPELPKDLRVSSRPASSKKQATVPASEHPENNDIVVPTTDLDTPESNAAIDDIVAQEADQVLAAEDAGIRAAQQDAVSEYQPPKEPHGHPIFWFLIVLLVIIAGLTFYVMTRPGLELRSPF